MHLTTPAWILIVIIALIVGVIIGFFIARRYMTKYFEENPPISAEMIRSMLVAMGQKPSEKRVQQILNQTKSASAKANKKKKKK